MFAFDSWFTEIVSYWDFVTSTAPVRVWVEGQKGITSCYDPYEFLEQVLGDLDLDNLIPIHANSLRSIGAYDAAVNFHRVLVQLEQKIGRDAKGSDVLRSAEWEAVRQVAEDALSVCNCRPV